MMKWEKSFTRFNERLSKKFMVWFLSTNIVNFCKLKILQVSKEANS